MNDLRGAFECHASENKGIEANLRVVKTNNGVQSTGLPADQLALRRFLVARRAICQIVVCSDAVRGPPNAIRWRCVHGRMNRR